jgi:hypothetical protein
MISIVTVVEALEDVTTRIMEFKYLELVQAFLTFMMTAT